jgi:hypothetical protein
VVLVLLFAAALLSVDDAQPIAVQMQASKLCGREDYFTLVLDARYAKPNGNATAE